MRTLAALTFVVLLPAVALARPPAAMTPREIIERAIVAHGGYEKLAQSRCEYVRLRGTLLSGPAPVPFTNELTLQLPGQYKSVLVVQQGARPVTVVHLLDADKASVLVDGKPQQAGALHLAQLRQTLQLEQAMRLVPLLTDPRFTLEPGQDFSYNGSVVTSVRVQARGQRELVLYFDQLTALLVKSEHRIDGPGGKEVLQEAFYSSYREVGGHQRAGKVLIQRDGKKVMEVELLSARRVERIDPVEFTRP